MADGCIIHELAINAPAADILRMVGEPEQINKWWLKKVEVTNDRLTLLLSDNTSHLTLQRRAGMPDTVEWLCLSHGIAPEWAGTVLCFHVTGSSLLRFTHGGWKNTDGVYGRTSFFWAALYLSRLKAVAEAG